MYNDLLVMGEKEVKINSYIAGVVRKFLPKNEEIIHSSLFLLLSKDEELGVIDWYFNGYSVISETISSYLQKLCKAKAVSFTNDGLYSVKANLIGLSKSDLEEAENNLDKLLAEYENGMQVLQEANRIYLQAVI